MAHPDDRMPEKNNVDVLVRRLALQNNTVRPHSVGLRVARSRANRRQVVCHLTAVKSPAVNVRLRAALSAT